MTTLDGPEFKPNAEPRTIGPQERERRVTWWLFTALTIGALIAIVATADRGGSGENAGPLAVASPSGDAPAVPTVGATSDEAEGQTPVNNDSFTIAVSGDVLIHESVAASAMTGDGFDFTSQLAAVTPILSDADLAICHLEVPLSATNQDLAYYPAFRVPYEVADLIADAGYDSCSVASNHALDAGPAGVESTIAALDRAGVAHAGTATSSAADAELNLVEANGVTVGHLSYAYGLNGYDALPADGPFLVDLIDEAAIVAEAAQLRAAGAEFVVLSMHWGLEYQTELTEQQATLAQTLLPDPNIDLIVGHHAHVVQEVRRIGDEYAVFGLGNHLSNQSPTTCSTCPAGTQDGVIVELTVTRNSDSAWKVTALEHTPTWVVLDGHTVVVASGSAPGADPAELAASAARTAAALGPLAPSSQR